MTPTPASFAAARSADANDVIAVSGQGDSAQRDRHSGPEDTDRRSRGARRMRPGRRGSGWRNAGWVLVFLLPSAVPLLLFTVIPMLASIWVSLTKWNLISAPTFVAFANYRRLLTDPATLDYFLHTGAYIVGYLPLVYIGGLSLAYVLDKKLVARSFFRAAVFLPVITSWVVVALVWQWLLNPAHGVVNTVLGALGLGQPGWWTDPDWAMPSIILASAWKDLGFVMVIMLAGLQSIPGDVQEAATVDGATGWQRFRRVTWPMLSPSTFFVVVISLINGLQVFDQVFVMTGGGPQGATQVVVGQIYNLTFRYGRAGDAAALSWILFVVILAITAGQLAGQRRWVTHA